MSLSFKQIGFRNRMTARLAVEPSIYGNISGNGSDLGYPKGKPEKLTVYRRWYQKPGTLAFGKNVKEMLGTSEFGAAPIDKGEVELEFNNRNYFSEAQAPIVTIHQAVSGAVSQVLTINGKSLIAEDRQYVAEAVWNSWVNIALRQARAVGGTRSTKGANWWK